MQVLQGLERLYFPPAPEEEEPVGADPSNKSDPLETPAATRSFANKVLH